MCVCSLPLVNYTSKKLLKIALKCQNIMNTVAWNTWINKNPQIQDDNQRRENQAIGKKNSFVILGVTIKPTPYFANQSCKRKALTLIILFHEELYFSWWKKALPYRKTPAYKPKRVDSIGESLFFKPDEIIDSIKDYSLMLKLWSEL